MTTIQLKEGLALFPSPSTTYFQSLKQRLWSTSPSALLLHELNAQDSLSYPTLLKVVAYLADHPHALLEQTLKDKLSKETSSTTLLNIQSVSMFSLLHGRLKMLDVCKRVVSLEQLKTGLNIDDVKDIAEKESRIIPKPIRKIEKLSEMIARHWQKCTYIFGKVINVFFHIITGTFSYVIVGLVMILYHPPAHIFEVKERYEGVADWFDFFTRRLPEMYFNLFPTREIGMQAGVLILFATIVIYFIHRRLNLGVPDSIDKKHYFQNTSLEAQMGKIRKMKGRLDEKEQVKTAWNVPPGEKFRIALLVGPTGCGKTEFVNGLAWESIYDPDSFVFRKKIFTINTIQLMEDPSYLDKILDKKIAGQEDDVILFFDEGHNGGSQEGKVGSLLELLKTKILDKNIRCILGTTNKEFKDNIEHNEAFVDRCKKIDFTALSDDDSKKILQDKVELDQERTIEIDADAYDELLYVAKVDPKYRERSNPRKVIDLYKDVRSHVLCWTPKTLNQQLALRTTERDDLKAACLTANNNSDWIDSPEGRKMTGDLEKKEQAVVELNEAIKNQTEELRKIAKLRSLQPLHRHRYDELVHQLAAQKESLPSETPQKEFLYLKHILKPALQATIESEVQRLSALYQEELPLKIDTPLIKKLYPDSYVVSGDDP